MPFADTKSGRIHYQLDGSSNGPVIIFSNSLGTNLAMWDPQVKALAKNWRIVRYDTRGHGQSAVTPGTYTIDQLGNDVRSVLDAAGIERANFCGLSLGGLTGIWLGIHAGNRFDRLALCNTAARVGTAEAWNARIATVRQSGMQAMGGITPGRWFTPGFVDRAPEVVKATVAMVEHTSVQGYLGCCEALRDTDLRSQLSSIQNPTLVIAGTHDPATPPADGKQIQDSIRGAQYVELNTSHLSNVEAPQDFTENLLRFLNQPEAK